MPENETTPQLYLITPPGADPDTFAPMLADVLDAVAVACVRLSGAGSEAALGRMADACREVAHARDVAIIIEDHVKLAQRHGLDGVHLGDGARAVRLARKELGADAIVGAFCAASRHEGLTAAEHGADYVAFGPLGDTALGYGAPAGDDLFHWWSEMIEVPVVAEGAVTRAALSRIGHMADFIAIGPDFWSEPDPCAALIELWQGVGAD